MFFTLPVFRLTTGVSQLYFLTMPIMPLDFARELESNGYARVASFKRFYDVRQTILSNKLCRHYVIAYMSKGIWFAYKARIKRMTPTRCVFEYDADGDGPLYTTDDSLPLQDQMPRRTLTARSCNYFLYRLS